MSDPFENLSVPDPPIRPDEKLKLALLNTRRSSAIGLAFVAVPALFVLCMVLKHELGIDLHVIDRIENFFALLDRNPFTRHWLNPAVFVLLPLTAVAINLLAILHVTYSRERRLLTLTIKLKALNLIVVLFAAALLGVLFAYQFAETFLGKH